MADVGKIVDEREHWPTSRTRRYIVHSVENVETPLVAAKAVRLHGAHAFADRRNRPERVIEFPTCSSRGALRAQRPGSGIRGGNPTETHLAWALHAGISYAVTQNFTVELAYRYLNYGSITDTVNCIGGCHPDSYKFNDLTSNDIMLGMRWRFPPTGFVAPAPPAAISTRG